MRTFYETDCVLPSVAGLFYASIWPLFALFFKCPSTADGRKQDTTVGVLTCVYSVCEPTLDECVTIRMARAVPRFVERPLMAGNDFSSVEAFWPVE